MLQFCDIVGQDASVIRLQQALANGRMPHALLFVGPAGVGRRTTAIALAATLLCENPAGLPPARQRGFAIRQACGQCASCRQMAAGSHPDFHLVNKELARFHEDRDVREGVMQSLSIKVVRDFLIKPAALTSLGRGKVFVVMEAELMSPDAQNALLKTLEEPPPGVTIILLAQRSEQLLPTTLSRCTLFRFGLLGADFVATSLTRSGIDPREAQFWADFTGGSVGVAQRHAAAGLYALKHDLIQRIGNLTPSGDAELGDHLVKTAEKLAQAAVKQTKDDQGADLSKTLATRRSTAVMIQFIASAFQDALRLRCGGGDGTFPIINKDQADDIGRMGRRFDSAQLARVIDQLSEYERLLWRNVNPKIVWDNVAITCSTAAIAIP